MYIKEKIILEHGPADGYVCSVRSGVFKLYIPIGCNGFRRAVYYRTLRNSGSKGEFRRIYTWVK